MTPKRCAIIDQWIPAWWTERAAEMTPRGIDGIAIIDDSGIEVEHGTTSDGRPVQVVASNGCDWHDDDLDFLGSILLVVRNDRDQFAVQARGARKQRPQPVGTIVLLDVNRMHALSSTREPADGEIWVAVTIDLKRDAHRRWPNREEAEAMLLDVCGARAVVAPAPTYDVSGDGRTVWVNGDRGDCLGRFSRFGIDVHRSAEQQMAGLGECLDCTHVRPTSDGWQRFKEMMALHHAVEIDDAVMPDWLKALNPTAGVPG